MTCTSRQSYGLLIVALFLLAAVPRFYQLGHLGFYGDEETTSTASRQYAEFNVARQASGMPYHRAMPQTVINAWIAKYVGVDNEVSYRVFAALTGTLTVVVVFVLMQPALGGWAAGIAAVLLALSDWHITVSREARMYAPFLLFYIMSCVYIVAWVTRGGSKYLACALCSALVSCIFHSLGMIAVAFALAPYLLRYPAPVHLVKAVAFALLTAILAQLYTQYFVNAPYNEWSQGFLLYQDTTAPTKYPWRYIPMALSEFGGPLYLLMLLGAATGISIAYRSLQSGGSVLYLLAWFGNWLAIGLLAALGQVYGVFLLLLGAGLYTANPQDLVRQARWSLAALAAVLGIGALAVCINLGIKSTLLFPFPYLLLYAMKHPALSICFIISVLLISHMPRNERGNAARLLAIAALVPFLGVGALKGHWHDLRYLLPGYPFILTVAAIGLVEIKNKLAAQQWLQMPAANTLLLLVVASGLLAGHGLPAAGTAATLDYGDRIPVKNWIYPDHKTAGEYVKQRLKNGDLVVAEDMLEQQWYVGRVDYWLRDQDKVTEYLYPDPKGVLRDFYVNSIIMTPEVLQEIEDTLQNQRLWVITSAETSENQTYFLSSQQRQWIASIEAKTAPVYLGKDGVTKVFLLAGEPSKTSNLEPIASTRKRLLAKKANFHTIDHISRE